MPKCWARSATRPAARVPKAAVTLTNQDTGIEVKTTTDENGNYDFFNVKVGRYTVTVEHAGFSKFTTTDVSVNVERPPARGRHAAGGRGHARPWR